MVSRECIRFWGGSMDMEGMGKGGESAGEVCEMSILGLDGRTPE